MDANYKNKVVILAKYLVHFTTNTLKAYLSAQPSSSSAFIISKIHVVVAVSVVAQKASQKTAIYKSKSVQ